MNQDHALPDYQPWLKRFTLLLAFATLLLIFIGGEVKSREAGLSVPDWPTTYGENMFLYPISKWQGPVFYEHFHRLVASGIGLLTIILAVWIWLKDKRRWVKVLAACALLTVILQGLLGGLTVLKGLPVWTSMGHGMLAQTFLVLLVIIAYALSRERAERKASPPPATPSRMRVGAIVFIFLVYVQLFLGAMMRHTESGLAIYDFPTTAGKIIPALGPDALERVNAWRDEFIKEHPDSTALGPKQGHVELWQMHLAFTHRLVALIIFVSLFALTGKAARQKQTHPKVFKTMHLLGGLLILQIILGASTVWTARMPLVASLHVATGAALLAAAVLLLLRAWPVRAVEELAQAPAAGEAQLEAS